MQCYLAQNSAPPKNNIKAPSVTHDYPVWMPRSIKKCRVSLFSIHSTAGELEMRKNLKRFQGCDKNGLDESFKMRPHLICLSWLSNFHIISRPDPEAGHKRDLGCQPRPIKWGLISKLSMSLFSWHPPKSLRSFFHFDSLSRPVQSYEAQTSNILCDRWHWLVEPASERVPNLHFAVDVAGYDPNLAILWCATNIFVRGKNYLLSTPR